MPAAGEIRRRVSSPANIIPIASGVIGAPRSPWITRAATSQEGDPASAQATDASMNPARLATYLRGSPPPGEVGAGGQTGREVQQGDADQPLERAQRGT